MQSNTFFKTKTVEEFKINNKENILVQQIINGGLLTNNYEIAYIRKLPFGLYCYSILDAYNIQDDYLTLSETMKVIKDIDKGFCYHKIKLNNMPKTTSKRKY